ncbi:MAG: hypothetical protein A3G75_14870 [Verrucomicrobia bacterium RIFCSPLOWO2_12_FULL_64_8]|nr:MAG: hypothetical protein A3G75_14870 [Verrucomicrobia bacterium RIFCSPLOWO2_12_FULL_64_8]
MPDVARSKISLDWKFLLLAPVPLLWCLANYSGGLQKLENALMEVRYRVRGEIDAPVKIAYVNVDTRALQALGERPWNREKFGFAAQALIEHGHARAVGFDFVFSALARSELVDPKREMQGNLSFGRVIKNCPNIVLGVQYTTGQAVTQQDAIRSFPLLRRGFSDRTKNDIPEMPQYPLVGPTWGRVGLIDVDYDYGGDEVQRWVPLFAHTVNPTLLHLSLALVLVDLGLDEQSVRISDDHIDLVRPDGRAVVHIPLTERQLLEANWFAPWGSFNDLHTSLADVLIANEQLESPDERARAQAQRYFAGFQDAIVLVGPTDSLLQDLAPTPFDRRPVPKVGVHGNLVKTIRSGLFLHHTPPSVDLLLTVGLTLVVSFLWIIGGAKGLRSKLTAVLLLVAFVYFALTFFRDYHLVVPLAAPLGGAFSTSFIALIWQVIKEEKQKGRIKGMFGTYLSPELVNRMVESNQDPQLGGHEEIITAYFSDIQSFSTFSEKMTAARLVELMNEYLTACTDIIQEEGGTLDKYIGDAVVAMFGAPITLPDHAYRACVSTLRVQQQIGELREKWKGETDRWPDIVFKLRARLGLNTGPAIIGNMGSRSRFSYTMMGDNVNLAARMESGAKSWGVYIMCTEATKQHCEHHGGDRIVFRPLGRIVVMGRSQPVPVYEVTGLKENVTAQTRECLGLFEQGLTKYYGRDWDGARQLFRQSAELEPLIPGKAPGVKTSPSLVYVAICEQYEHKPPPENWDGAYVMTEK